VYKPYQEVVELGRAWSGNLGDRDGRVDLIGSGNIALVMFDYCRFGRARKDDVQLLAPIYQCCVIRASTFIKLVRFLVADYATRNGTGSGQSLSAAMRESLSADVISGVLNAAHLTALDRRIRLIAVLVYDCLINRGPKSRDFRRVVIDDGF